MYMLMLLDIAIIGGVNLRSNFSPGVCIKVIIKACKEDPFYRTSLSFLKRPLALGHITFGDGHPGPETLSF